MTHGQPDFGATAQKETVFALSDMAELAARLKSIVTFDRRGDVVWLDDMEGIVTQWYLQSALQGQAVAQDSTLSRNGSKSLKLTTGSTGAGVAQVYRYLQLPVHSKVGLEVSFILNTSDTRVFIGLFIYDGTNYNDFFVRYHADEGKFYYLDEDGNYTELGLGYALRVQAGLFHTVKLVADFTTNKYIRAMLDSQEFDLSAYPAGTVASSTLPSIILVLGAVANPVAARVVSFDDVILTQNEP